MADPYEIAKLLIHLAAQEPEPDYLTHLRLQKLLYYVQGWSLAMRDRPMFADRIEAWKNGPVVRSVYPRFADFGKAPISPEEVAEPRGLADEDRRFVVSVWEGYKRYSAPELWRRTHAEPPYLAARGDAPPDSYCDAEITGDAMRQFFRGEYDRLHVPGFEPDELAAAQRDLTEGRGVSLDQIAEETGYAV